MGGGDEGMKVGNLQNKPEQSFPMYSGPHKHSKSDPVSTHDAELWHGFG